ncbi:TonB family protein [Novosphingobium sp. MMS21-SN21R]|uniref:TonB family protein n=1 Tax=Novosphingobium sp. MMS21-SN21R TaxID=2969298 RepID=UPI0028837907|nr:TonB family protein [Novosphingobium sp. MMS21-SN21R]MDT0508416.1 TonB family protein [Novosphingobium sp. MMS21-SN21R]
MATADTFDPGGGGGARQTIFIVLGGVLLAGLIWFVWNQLTQPITRKVAEEQQIVAMIEPDLPPPPPPPPPPEVKPPEPTEQQLTPAPVPQAAPDAPAQTQMDAAPSAGVGGIAAGTGSGMGAPGGAGTCLSPPCGVVKSAAPFNEAFYRRTLSSELQSYIDRDKRLSRLVFDAGLHISISSSGVVTSVSLVKPSGKAEVDQQLTAVLRGIRGLSPPPAGVRFPQNVKVRGRRPFS